MREERNVSFCGAKTGDDQIGTVGELLWRFPGGTALLKQVPIGAFRENVSGRAALIVTAGPLGNCRFNLRDRPEACQFTRPLRPLERTDKDFGKRCAPQ